MEDNQCPNAAACILIHRKGFVDESKKAFYTAHYCFAETNGFKACKRYQTALTLHFCPDFVFPDSLFTTDEILTKYEEENDL